MQDPSALPTQLKKSTSPRQMPEGAVPRKITTLMHEAIGVAVAACAATLRFQPQSLISCTSRLHTRPTQALAGWAQASEVINNAKCLAVKCACASRSAHITKALEGDPSKLPSMHLNLATGFANPSLVGSFIVKMAVFFVFRSHRQNFLRGLGRSPWLLSSKESTIESRETFEGLAASAYASCSPTPPTSYKYAALVANMPIPSMLAKLSAQIFSYCCLATVAVFCMTNHTGSPCDSNGQLTGISACCLWSFF
mmetsp:Transcript_123431/g.308428  ORF Transcript_123431/g.308428 Transcript_123431/m.308428 type:complete len:253 (-) Transcript_123431:627-1385(-)